MANNTTTFSSFSSRPRNSKRAPHSFRRPAQAVMMMMPTNRKRKEVVELSSHKPQLSLLRDRDKLLLPRHRPVPVLEQEAGLTVLPLKSHKEFHQFKSYDKITKSRSACCNISSLPSTRQEEKTNGYSNSANKCPMALSKYSSPSAPFFFLKLYKWTACPCLLHVPCQYYFWKCNDRNERNHDDRRNDKLCKGIKTKIRTTEALSPSSFSNSNNSKRNCKKFCSILILFFMHFLLARHIIPESHASPLPTLLSPTQTTLTDTEYSKSIINNGNRKYFDRLQKRQLSEKQADKQENDEFSFKHHNPYMINNTIFDDGGDDHQVTEIKDETNSFHVNRTIGQSKGRNLYNRNKSGSESNGSSNQLDFASLPKTPPELPNNSNNKNKMELWNKNEKEVLTTMPLAVKKRTEVVKAPSSSSSSSPVNVLASTFKQVTTAPVTNDLSQEMNESGGGSSSSTSSENNDDDESSFVLINNSNDNNNYDGVPSIMTVATTSNNVTLGKCWTVDTSEEMEDTEKSPFYFLLPMSEKSADPLLTSSHADVPTTKMIGLMCNGTNDLAITLQHIPEKLVHQVNSIVVKDSLIYTLDLSLFHRFSHLENVSVTYSNITQIIGTCPVGLKALNISFNNIRKLNGSIFSTSGYSQSYDDEEDEEVDHDDGGDIDNLEESTNASDKVATNFSKELMSTYFSSTAEQLFEQKKNKSDSVSELLSLSPSPSSLSSSLSSGPSEKIIQDNSKIKTDSHPKKLTGIPSFLGTRTKKMRPTRLLSNEENQNDDLEANRPSYATILSSDRDRRHHHLYQMRMIKSSVETSNVPEAVDLEASFETGETNESNVDDDSDDDEENEDGDDISEVVSKKDNDFERNNSEEKNTLDARRKATPTESGVDFFASDKETNINCAINNDSLCKSGIFVRKSRQVTREVNEDTENGNDQLKKQSLHDNAKRDRETDFKNDGSEKEHKKKENSNVQEHNSYRSSTLSASRGMASSIVNKGEDNAIKEGSKPKPTFFPDGKKLSTSRTKLLTTRKRKARTSVTATGSSTPTSLSLEDIDLSHNKISEIPRALLQLKGLKSLHLSGNQLKCDFVWEKLAEWYMKAQDATILKDGDDTFCGVVDDVRVFQFTVLGVLKAKKDLVETCRTVDKTICHECSLYSLNKQPGLGYNLSHQSTHGNVAIALKLDCSFRNLTSLPAVPPQTWQLNVSGNVIKDLIPLKEPMYENLLILDADSNEIDTLDGLIGTSFLDRYNILSLQNNRFSQIPSSVLSSLKNMRGQGVTFLGANFIDCDCDVVKDIKPLLLENSKQIKDLKEIYCKDMKSRTSESYMAVKDLQYTDLCYMDSEESNEMYLYLIILVELLLIFVIVAKVWHDQRTFRRTGILPWCSAKMPRLPCDAMLESVKEPPHVNRSSSTNVRSYACEPPATQSISSCVQLRDVRSNSGQSEKSSQISQLSSFPCSSRTSSV